MDDERKILTINPGNTSTKVAVVSAASEDGEQTCCTLAEETYRHEDGQLDRFEQVADQLEFRMDRVWDFLREIDTDAEDLAAVAGRGGLARPAPGGTYPTCQALLEDLRRGAQGQHPANLGGLMAHRAGEQLGVPSYIVDPVCVDELTEEARISGLPQMCRRSLWHALNCRAVARRAASILGGQFEEANLIVVHLGSGITVVALQGGRAVDLTDPTAEGPFGADRAGGLPATGVVDLAFSGEYTHAQLRKIMMGQGGMYAYLGTRDMQKVIRRARRGEEEPRLLLDAMVYQISKTVGAMGSVLTGDVDAVVLTGGMAHSDFITGAITDRVAWVAEVLVLPGEDELHALAAGAWRVLTGREEPVSYPYGG